MPNPVNRPDLLPPLGAGQELETTLAGWLLGPAEPAEVKSRQEAVADLAPRFPHQKEYLAQVIADLDAWVEGGPTWQRPLRWMAIYLAAAVWLLG
mgnify:CR=1 FL=1